MGKKSAPSPPDYQALAQQQSGEQQNLLNQQTWANRPNQNSPWGSQSWTQQTTTDPSTGKPVTQWTQNTTLNPDLQRAFNSQMQAQASQADIAHRMLGQVNSALAHPLDTSGLGGWGSSPQYQGTSAVTDPFGFGVPQPTTSANGRGVNPTTGPNSGPYGRYGPGETTGAGAIPMGPTTTGQARVGAITQAGATPMGPVTTGRRGVNPVNSRYTAPINPTITANNGFGFGGTVRPQNIDTTRQGVPQLQQGLNFGGVQSVDSSQAARQRAEDAIYRSATSRLDPQWQQRQKELEGQLANSGIARGSGAYQQAMDDFNRQRTDAYQQAQMGSITGGGAEAQRSHGMDLALRGQQVGEIGQQGQFRNQALGDQFGMGQQARQGQLTAQQAAYEQALRSGQYGREGAQDAFNQQLAAGQYGRQGEQQNFEQRLASGEFGSAQEQQAFNQRLASGQFGRQGEQQAFEQNLASGQFGSSQEEQAFRQRLASGEFTTGREQQAFEQAMARGQFGRQGEQQSFEQALASGQFGRQGEQQAFDQMVESGRFGLQGQQQGFDQRQQSNAQNFNQQLALAQYQNQMRQQQLQELLTQRSLPLSEYQSLMGGSQVGMPSFGDYTSAGQGVGTDYMGAASQGYQGQMDQFNQKQAGRQNTIGTIGSMAAMFF